MSILLPRTYKIFILFDNKLEEYEKVKNNIKFWEKWTKDLKKELNNQYKIVFDRLESLKEYKGQGEQLKEPINIDGREFKLLYSDRVNRDIRIIFSIFYNTNKIIVWGIDHHEKAYGKILKRAKKFIEDHKKSILEEFLGIKAIYR